jgi:hypothetical protein
MAIPKPGSKYAALYEHLRRQASSSVEMSLAAIEALLGGPLPASARRGAAFWSNRQGGLQSAAWLSAGFKVTRVDRRRQRVRFERPRARPRPSRVAGQPRWDGAAVRALREHLDLNQEGLAELLGVRQQTISEWETGLYAPSRGRSKHLDLVAERSGFGYKTEDSLPK